MMNFQLKIIEGSNVYYKTKDFCAAKRNKTEKLKNGAVQKKNRTTFVRNIKQLRKKSLEVQIKQKQVQVEHKSQAPSLPSYSLFVVLFSGNSKK